VYPIVVEGQTILPDKQWIWERSKVDAAIQNNEVVVNETSGKISVRVKQYLKDADGNIREKKPLSILIGPFNQEGNKEIEELFGSKVFSFPKPSELVRQFVSLTVNDTKAKDDIILDFFAGSGTTGHAVMAQNAADGGNRKFVLVQLPEPTGRDDYKTIADLTAERLRRAGKKIKQEHEATLESQNKPLDTGFRVFKLDSANVKAWDAPTTDAATPAQIGSLIEGAVDAVKPDRTDADLLWGILINLGLPLDSVIETKEVDGKTVHIAAAGTLLCCFAKSIDMKGGEKLAEALAQIATEKKVEGELTVVLRDTAFGGKDAAKVNLVENLKQRLPDSVSKSRVLSI
jgi:adenine-specific DNA-methyltransferase